MRTMINDMKEGNSYSTTMLVTNVTEGTATNGKTFVTLFISDGVTNAQAKMFNTTLSRNSVYIMKVCDMEITASLYGGNISYIVGNIKLSSSDNKITDFIIKAPMDSEKMYAQIMEILNGCTSNIKNIAINLYKENKDKLLYWSAARSCHHNFYGGLLYHTLRMLSHACTVCKIYKGLNYDLMVAGVVLHDIGKLEELATNEVGAAEYTVDGNLFGHTLIGVEMVTKEVLKNPDAYNEEEVRLLKHMIATHHGTLEYGAIRKPATMEAFALNFIDDMDAKMQICETTFANMETGTMMDKEEYATKSRLYRNNL